MPAIRGHDEKTTDVGIVEHAGFEPATLCLQSRCATNCANAPSPRHGGGKEVGENTSVPEHMRHSASTQPDSSHGRGVSHEGHARKTTKASHDPHAV